MEIKSKVTVINDKEIIINENISRGFLALVQERLNTELQDEFCEYHEDVDLKYLKNLKNLNMENITEAKIKLLKHSNNKILINVFDRSIKSNIIENEKINSSIKKIEDMFIELLDKAAKRMSYISSN